MKPLAVLNGIIMGSSFAIWIGLVVVLFLYGLNAHYDYIREEIPNLVVHAVIFTGVTVVAALSFWGTVRERWWLWYGQAAMYAVLAAVVVYYWPE
ncbi:hypothetical protein VCB98_00710 [Gammaproteobacteria bacterium AB-CW1]|uniref:Uncharacterized protein n=1 Tax=Natronospira elongata TaxID=3110268 RepID=A0AAP6JDD9_9GAMM|nr:hypothetical protein [Gammaproteobacteria bacterium AB-CW1]